MPISHFYRICIPCIFLAVLGLDPICMAQSEEEMQLLRMFYKDKDLVVSSTRTPKSISQVADNITVITDEDIEGMNAHTIADVLKKVPNLFITSNQDFGASSIIAIQGSEDRHVLVLVDEIPWNFLSGGNAETSTIPVGAIDRMEIIKGPASSSWGSSLGGVVNIITKNAGKPERPSGIVGVSYGKSGSRDYWADLSGNAGTAGYYLYANKQNSDGLVSSRSFDGQNFFSKVDTPVYHTGELSLELGYNSSETGFGDSPESDSYSNSSQRNLYARGSLKLVLVEDLDFNLSLFHLRRKFSLDMRSLGISGFLGPYGTLYLKNVYKEDTTGARCQFVYTKEVHTLVFGLEYDKGNLEQRNLSGLAMQSMGSPAELITTPDVSQWAAYVNDSIGIGKFSITPGIRYDYNSNSGSFVSPSLGSTYMLWDNTILRASVSRGFTTPSLSMVAGGGLFTSPNPSLEPEKIWSYQAGMESSILDFLWVKITLFRHDVKDILKVVYEGAGPPTYNDIYVNEGESRRQGVEVETETVPFHNISLSAGFSRTGINPPLEGSLSSAMYSMNVGLKYNDNKSIHAEVSGCYQDWDVNNEYMQSDYDDFIWDFNVNKKIMINNKVTPEFFFAAHNIFNGDQYPYIENKNPQRWLEGGIKLYF